VNFQARSLFTGIAVFTILVSLFLPPAVAAQEKQDYLFHMRIQFIPEYSRIFFSYIFLCFIHDMNEIYINIPLLSIPFLRCI